MPRLGPCFPGLVFWVEFGSDLWSFILLGGSNWRSFCASIFVCSGTWRPRFLVTVVVSNQGVLAFVGKWRILKQGRGWSWLAAGLGGKGHCCPQQAENRVTSVGASTLWAAAGARWTQVLPPKNGDLRAEPSGFNLVSAPYLCGGLELLPSSGLQSLLLTGDGGESILTVGHQVGQTATMLLFVSGLPPFRKRSLFISIPKKDNAKGCSNYRTVVLISHTAR